MNTVAEIIENRLEKGADHKQFTFLADGENTEISVTLSGLRRNALKISTLLAPQSTVLICLPQGISFAEAFFGCFYAGAIAVPVSIPTKNRGVEQLFSIIKDADASVGITNRNTLANLHKWFGENAFPPRFKWLLIEDVESDEVPLPIPITINLPHPAQIAFLQYTSGSTASPKAVMVTHENIVANSQIIQTCFRNDAYSTSVCWLPSFHDMGLIDGIIQPVFTGFHGVLMSPTHFLQKPVRWFKAITKYKATYSGAPNFAFDFCTDRIKDDELENIDLSSLNCLYNGAEPIRAKTLRRFVERFAPMGYTTEKLFTCYGLAEATLAVSTSTLGKEPNLVKVDENSLRQNRVEASENEPYIELVGCGLARCDTVLKVVNPETLRECVEKEIGEVWVGGKSVTAGYRNNAGLTGETFVNLDGETFLRTGDLGFLLNKELFITGRIKDLIVIRGKNHYPQDIEQTVSNSHHALELNGCAAFAVEVEQSESLVVVQEIKRTSLLKADFSEIFNNILSEISQRHLITPHDVVLISPNTLPKTTSGKVRRNFCGQLWRAKNLKSVAHLREYNFSQI